MAADGHPFADRAAGAIVGGFIGDALALGVHWYYDLEEQRANHGEWISGYTAPLPGRYHEGLNPGDPSQAGIILELLLDSVARRGFYDEEDFCDRMDHELLPHLDGTPKGGPGGYTNHSLRQVWQARIGEGKSWSEAAGDADTSEGAERAIIPAARHARNLRTVAESAASCCRLSQSDALVVQQSTAFAMVLADLIGGGTFDPGISGRLFDGIRNGQIPFVAKSSAAERTSLGFPSPDALLLPSWIAEMAADPDIRIEPAWKISLVYGMSCAINFVLPAAYYLAARFPDNFEAAVLHAINGGGQNMSRACLTGALVGAQTGLSGIPERFINGLSRGDEILRLAREVAQQAANE